METDKKIDEFAKVVLNDAKSQKEQIMADLELRFKQACDESRKKAENDALKKFDDKSMQAHKKLTEQILEASINNKKAILTRRNELISKSAENIEERLNKYILTSEYQEHLIEDLTSSCSKYKPKEIYLTVADYKRIGKEFDGVPCKQSDVNFIGGYKLNIDDNMVVDNTFLSKFLNAKQDMNFKV